MEEKIDYNDIPVAYCKHCLSLNIISDGLDYCKNCGSTDIEEASLDDYDVLHKKRFGKKLFYRNKQ